MSLTGILSSPSQRRLFYLTSGLMVCISTIVIFGISVFAPATPLWGTANNILSSILASGLFALLSGVFVSYFFVDPNAISATSILLPKDIGPALRAIAENAPDYRIFVRTGRHFRAEILPILIKRARETRKPIQIEVILLDFQDVNLCDRYASYRKASSFDKKLWDVAYVQKEVVATILLLVKASRENRGLVDITLYLSRRLSIFRIEGSSNEVLVTREDPKDTAWRYVTSHHDFSAYAMELNWVRDESRPAKREDSGVLPKSLGAMFGESEEAARLEKVAARAMNEPSPYVR